MHAHILKIFVVDLLVKLGGQATQTIFREIDSQRVDASDKHVQAQIKFKTLHQVRLINIELHDTVLLCYIVDLTR